jgi:hypothetical protein
VLEKGGVQVGGAMDRISGDEETVRKYLAV